MSPFFVLAISPCYLSIYLESVYREIRGTLHVYLCAVEWYLGTVPTNGTVYLHNFLSVWKTSATAVMKLHQLVKPGHYWQFFIWLMFGILICSREFSLSCEVWHYWELFENYVVATENIKYPCLEALKTKFVVLDLLIYYTLLAACLAHPVCKRFIFGEWGLYRACNEIQKGHLLWNKWPFWVSLQPLKLLAKLIEITSPFTQTQYQPYSPKIKQWFNGRVSFR